jgi:hypothetical protein
LDDWKKLLRVLGYLQGTAEITFTLTCEKLDKLTWFIDGSYASHMDMRGQSGGVLMTGNCAVLFKSCKQKVNTRSSTEAEDNRSTMLLMKNGKLSSGKRTKHLDVRYFYVKDLLDRGIIKLSHCLSEKMIADVFTKPIQGRRFVQMRNIILNVQEALKSNETSPSRAQERVGKQLKRMPDSDECLFDLEEEERERGKENLCVK